jgi:hypothetical protein
MELLHRQEELEHAELEKALLLSLAVEEERLAALMSDIRSLGEEATALSLSSNAAVADEKVNLTYLFYIIFLIYFSM